MPLSQRVFGNEGLRSRRMAVRTMAPMMLARMAGGRMPVTMA